MHFVAEVAHHAQFNCWFHNKPSANIWATSVGTWWCALSFLFKQITVFDISSEEQQDIDVAILKALLQGV